MYNRLEVINYEQSPDFIFLSETHLTRDIEVQEVRLNRYNNYITHSYSNRTRGVVFMIML